MSFPGSNFTTIGGKIKGFVQGPTTERLLIIGTSQDGPINTPVRVTDTVTASRIFGPVTYSNGYLNPNTALSDGADSGATLPRAVAQAIAAGCTDIYLCRATGNYATAPSAFSSKLDLTSIYPGRVYNQCSLGLIASGGLVTVVVTQPSIKGTTYTTTYASSMTVGDLIDNINANTNNVCLSINKWTYSQYLSGAAYTTLCTSALVTVTLASGTNGCEAIGEDFANHSKDKFATALTTTDTGTFDMLSGQRFRFNIAVLTGIYIDDQIVTSGNANPNGGNYAAADEYSYSIATDFVYWLDAVSSVVGPCFGVIACRPNGYRDTKKLINYATNSLLSQTAGYWDQNQRWIKPGYFLYTGWTRIDPIAGAIDLGCRLAVCAGPEVVFTDPVLGNYTDNFHVSYAALSTTLPPENACVFKQLVGPVSFGTPIPAKYCDQLLEGVGFNANNNLSGQGAYTVLTRSPRDPLGPLVVYDDVTVTARDDYMRNYQLVHLCNSIHNNLDYALGPFIGGPTSPSSLSAMETVVQNIMDGYVASNALRGAKGVGYDFTITMQGTDASLGVVRIYIEISPATCLRKIFFTVAVRQTA